MDLINNHLTLIGMIVLGLWGAMNELLANNPNFDSNSVFHWVFLVLGWAKKNTT